MKILGLYIAIGTLFSISSSAADRWQELVGAPCQLSLRDWKFMDEPRILAVNDSPEGGIRSIRVEYTAPSGLRESITVGALGIKGLHVGDTVFTYDQATGSLIVTPELKETEETLDEPKHEKDVLFPDVFGPYAAPPIEVQPQPRIESGRARDGRPRRRQHEDKVETRRTETVNVATIQQARPDDPVWGSLSWEEPKADSQSDPVANRSNIRRAVNNESSTLTFSEKIENAHTLILLGSSMLGAMVCGLIGVATGSRGDGQSIGRLIIGAIIGTPVGFVIGIAILIILWLAALIGIIWAIIVFLGGVCTCGCCCCCH